MATSKDPQKPNGPIFQMVTTRPSENVNREVEGGVLQPSGHFKCNTNGSASWIALVSESGLSVARHGVVFGADRKGKRVACYPATPESDAVSTVKVTNGIVTMHLDGVFTEHPMLRPAGERKVTMEIIQDGAGKNCMVIYLQTSQKKARYVAKNDEGDAKAQKETKRKRKGNKDKATEPAAETKPTTETKPTAETKPAEDQKPEALPQAQAQ